jgi:hypothetical protein
MGIRLCETRRVMSMPCSMSSTSAIQVCRGGRGDLALQRRITMLYGHREPLPQRNMLSEDLAAAHSGMSSWKSEAGDDAGDISIILRDARLRCRSRLCMVRCG